MLIPEIIQRAVGGQLKFDFIESSITALAGDSLSTIGGRARADSADGCFHFHFISRGPLPEEWPGLLEPAADAGGGAPRFRLEGIERGSAGWSGSTSVLRLTSTAAGTSIHGQVREWSRSDARAVHLSFERVVVAGRLNYPARSSGARGRQVRTAAISCARMDVNFRCYGNYTEISATSDTGCVPPGFAECATAALAECLQQPVEWVYREHHSDSRRNITVRAAQSAARFDAGVQQACARGYGEFWDAYTRKLSTRLNAYNEA